MTLLLELLDSRGIPIQFGDAQFVHSDVIEFTDVDNFKTNFNKKK
jgi:hypothetical protein